METIEFISGHRVVLTKRLVEEVFNLPLSDIADLDFATEKDEKKFGINAGSRGLIQYNQLIKWARAN